MHIAWARTNLEAKKETSRGAAKQRENTKKTHLPISIENAFQNVLQTHL